jgi:exonuclease 3'-5' domain-containing protein 1
MFAPEHGGSYEVFNQRPLPAELVEYCVHDVQWLPKLFDAYKTGISEAQWVNVNKATLDRIEDSKSVGYVGQGEHKVIGPWDFRGNAWKVLQSGAGEMEK